MKNTAIYLVLLCVLLIAGYGEGIPEKPMFAYQDRVGDASAILTALELEEEEIFDIQRFSSGNLCAEALITENAHVATMGDAVAVTLASRYPEKIVFLGVHGDGPSRHRMVSRDVNPARIAVKFGTSTHAALLDWLRIRENASGTPFPRLIDMSPDLQLTALSSGEVDALSASEPTPSIMADKLMFLGESFTITPLTISGRSYPLVLVATRQAVELFQEQIDLMIERLKDNGETLSFSGGLSEDNRQVLASVTGLNPSLLEKSLGLHRFGFTPIAEYTGELRTLAEFLLAQGVIRDLPDFQAVSQ